VTSASPEGTRADVEGLGIRELEATVVAMRDALEQMEREGQERLQAALVDAAGETEQLHGAIAALRAELEAQQQRHGDELQEQRRHAADEVRQLQATIQAIRAELEARGR
jgi:hypothetical protein